MKKKKIIIITSSIFASLILVAAITTPILLLRKTINFNIRYQDYMNSDQFLDFGKELKRQNPSLNETSMWKEMKMVSNGFGHKFYDNWFDSLTYKGWSYNDDGFLNNLFCSSQRQALFLYLNCWGHFWNVDLHKGITNVPNSFQRKNYFDYANISKYIKGDDIEIRGMDYQYIDSCINNTESPINFVVYHGLEFMENEFYDQLKNRIKDSSNGLDFSQCIGSTITNYGFLSTTTYKEQALNYSNGFNWLDNDKLMPPLKEPSIFKIEIPYQTSGIVYVSDFGFFKEEHQGVIYNSWPNHEMQIMIKRNSTFIITHWNKNNQGINEFTLRMIS